MYDPRGHLYGVGRYGGGDVVVGDTAQCCVPSQLGYEHWYVCSIIV